MHGSFDKCLENSAQKVLQFGVCEQDDPRLGAFNCMLLEGLRHPPRRLDPVEYTAIAAYLAAMGRAEPPVAGMILERLETSLEFEALGGPDMHTDPAGYPTIPQARRQHPLIHPKYNEGGKYRYPLVYDVLAYKSLSKSLAARPDIRRKLNTVIGYTLDERYQRLPWGYGLILTPPNKYYGMGWSVHLPRFFKDNNAVADCGIVWWMETMAHFDPALQSDWFQNNLEHLEGFRTGEGRWKFPPACIAEAQDKYFVGGAHMGLGENRKERDALTLLSTAWMLRIDEAASR